MTYPDDATMILLFAITDRARLLVDQRGEAIRLSDEGGGREVDGRWIDELLARGYAEWASPEWNAQLAPTERGKYHLARWLRREYPQFKRASLSEVLRVYKVAAGAAA